MVTDPESHRMLGNPKLRKAASLGTVAVGVVTLVAPQKAAVLGDRLSLAPRYEDLGDGKFTPRDWYVDATRASGAGDGVGEAVDDRAVGDVAAGDGGVVVVQREAALGVTVFGGRDLDAEVATVRYL